MWDGWGVWFCVEILFLTYFNIMKKYFIFAAAAIVAASCAKAPAPVQTPDGPEAPAVEGKVAVQFGTNIIANVETKAAVTGWDKQDLYIYGFQRIKNGDQTVIDYESLVDGISKPFINNVMAKAPAALAQNEESPAGPNLSGTIEVKNGDEPFYYSGTTTYDFFGYYVQDAATGPSALNKSKDAYELPITIDGTQDIMTAVADHTYACDKAFGKDPGSNRPSGWNDNYAFSAYAARRGVNPYLVFKHELTQLNFKVTSGTVFTTATQLHVTDVTIKAVPSKATLCVAGATPGVTVDMTSSETETNSIVDLKVKKSDDADLEPVKVPTATASGEPSTIVAPDADPVGQSIMLFPAEEFEIWLTIAQGITEGHPTPTATEVIKRTINIRNITQAVEPTLGKFGAGYAYDITFKVYGLESVDITAELTKWQTGGSVVVDTDDTPTIF